MDPLGWPVRGLLSSGCGSVGVFHEKRAVGGKRRSARWKKILFFLQPVAFTQDECFAPSCTFPGVLPTFPWRIIFPLWRRNATSRPVALSLPDGSLAVCGSDNRVAFFAGGSILKVSLDVPVRSNPAGIGEDKRRGNQGGEGGWSAGRTHFHIPIASRLLRFPFVSSRRRCPESFRGRSLIRSEECS